MNDQSGGIAISMDEYLVSSGGYLVSSGYALSSGMSAASMGLLARVCSRGGVILNDGRRVAAATVIACNVQTVSLPAGAGAVALAAAAQLVAIQAAATEQIIPDGDIKSAAWTENDGTMADGDEQTINSGGTGTVTTLNGTQTINSGGTGMVTTMNGFQDVNSGGTGTIVTMNGGNQFVSGGGTVMNLNSGGTQIVETGGSGTVMNLNSSGGQTVWAGGTGTVETMNGGSQVINDGGTGNITTMSGGTQNVSSGGTVKVETMNGGTQKVENGGSGTVTNLNSGGGQTVWDGGTGTVTTMDGGTQKVENGGTGTVETMSGGTQTVSSGGTGTVATMNGGTQIVYEGGTGTVENLNSGGTQIVSGGTSFVTNLNSGGIVSVAFDVLHQQDGDTSPIHIGSGGTVLLLDQGGTLALDHKYQYGIRVSNGVVELKNGGKTWDATRGPTTILYGVFDGDNKLTGSGLMIVRSGAEAGDTVLSAGAMQIVEGRAGGDYASGGPSHVTYTNVSAGGTQIVKNGAIASRTYIHPQHKEIVLSGGTQFVLSGGIANSTHINSKTSSFEYETITNGGVQIVQGTANTTFIHPKGTQIVSAGGTANNTIINLNKTESNTTSNNFEYEDISVGGLQIVQGGGTANNTHIYSKGTQIVSSGAAVTSTTVSGGSQVIVGTATDTTILSGGTQNVSDGGTATGTTILSGGTQNVGSGGTVSATTIGSGGTQNVSSGGTVSATTINDGGTLNMEDGAKASGTLQGQGRVDGISVLSVGGTDCFSSVAVSGGSIYTSNGFVIGSGGSMTVENTGETSNTTVKSGGTLSVLGGGTANGVTLDGGTLLLAPNARPSGTVGGHGSVAVCTDDTCASVDTNAVITLGGTHHFSSFTVSGGTLSTPNGFQITSSGGITVNSGGTMVTDGAVAVMTSGTLTISSGGVFSAGSVSVVNGGEVSMSGGMLEATDDISIDQALTNAYGDVGAGKSLRIGAGATQPGGDKTLNLSAGTTMTASGNVTANELSAGGDIDAAGKTISAALIHAGGTVTAGSIRTGSLSAASLSAGVDVTVAGGGMFLASGGVAGSMSITGSVSASAQGRPALSAETGIELGDGFFILVPSGGSVGPFGDGVAVLDASGNPAERVVIGSTPPVEPTLRWKYAKNANGWYCAQLSLAWYPAYAEGIGNMRLLFADRTDAQGRLTAYLVDPATVVDPLPATEEHDDVEYRVAPVDLSGFAGLSAGTRAVYGVSDETMTNALSIVPQAERKICLRVANRDLSTVERVENKLAILAWDSGDESFFLPLAQTMASAQSNVQQSFLVPRRSSPAPRPLSVAEANLSTAFGLAPAAVARGTVTCRISSISLGPDGTVEGTFSIAAEDAGRVVAESGQLVGEAKLTVLGAESLDGPFEPLGASAGAELLSREPPYAFRVADPGRNAFFKVQIECEDLYE